jgi:hypothetical protein
VPLWDNHERRVLSVLRGALDLLAAQRPTGDEADLNRALYGCILTANANIRKAGGEAFDYPPTWEGRNPPTPATLALPAERKIPDFLWGYIDHNANDAQEGARLFCIECKKLGARTAAGRIFTVDYITHGVHRFVHQDWRYGKDVPSGAMVGYVENLRSTDILREVNAAAKRSALPSLRRAGSSGSREELEHTLKRTFAVSPFLLRHMWTRIA